MNRQERIESTIAKVIGDRKPATLIDIGVGTKSEWRTLGRIWPEMKIIGAEANPFTWCEIMRAGFPGTLLCCAVSYDGFTDMSIYDEKADHRRRGSASLFPLPDADKRIRVASRTLDDLWLAALSLGMQEPAILWLDCEGAELAVLEQGTACLRTAVKWINVEVRPESPQPGWPCEKQIREFLDYHGFREVCSYANCGTHHDSIYEKVGP